jgi:hypothetical protein
VRAGGRGASILDRIEAASPITVRPAMNDALRFFVTVAESSHREFYRVEHCHILLRAIPQIVDYSLKPLLPFGILLCALAARPCPFGC